MSTRFFLVTTCVALLSFSLNVLAAQTMTTHWNFENHTSQSIAVACQGKAQGLSDPITFPSLHLKAGEKTTYDWGDGWHNDGMGLNPAEWRCTVVPDSGSKIPEDTHPAIFLTQWGETVYLAVSGAAKNLTLEKVDSQGFAGGYQKRYGPVKK